MHHSEQKEIVILKDDIDNHYSIACSDCDTSMTHTCGSFDNLKQYRFGHLYNIENQKTYNVLLLTCQTCGLLDVSNDLRVIHRSIHSHEGFHYYFKELCKVEEHFWGTAIQVHFVEAWEKTLGVWESKLQNDRSDRVSIWLGNVSVETLTDAESVNGGL